MFKLMDAGAHGTPALLMQAPGTIAVTPLPLLDAPGVDNRLPPTPTRRADRWEKWQGTSQTEG